MHIEKCPSCKRVIRLGCDHETGCDLQHYTPRRLKELREDQIKEQEFEHYQAKRAGGTTLD